MTDQHDSQHDPKRSEEKEITDPADPRRPDAIPRSEAAMALPVATEDNPGAKPKAGPVFFDAFRHERVQELHKAGIATTLGEKWGHLIIGLRPTHVHAVVVARESMEQHLRSTHSVPDGKDTPAEHNVTINRAAIRMAITFAEGRVAPSPKMKLVAQRHGFPTETLPDGTELVVLSRGLDLDHLRLFLDPLLEASMPFLTLLVRKTQEFQQIKDEVLDKAGKDYVHGLTGAPELAG